MNKRDQIKNNREEQHASEMQRRREYDEAHSVSRNRPNYKSTSTKIITEVIKFSHLSPYNSGSPMKS
jgi:abortive infection bacteriophage resistance protein